MFRILILLSLAVMVAACDHNDKIMPPPEYTIHGRVIDATAGTFLANETMVLTWQANRTDKPRTLATMKMDAQGWFTLKYTQLAYHKPSGYDPNPARLLLYSDFFSAELPINRSIDTIFYQSSKGTIIIKLQTDKPMGPNDTLWLETYPLGVYTLDHFVAPPPNMIYGPFRVSESDYPLWYSRISQAEIGRTPRARAHVRFDPYVDTVTVHY